MQTLTVANRKIHQVPTEITEEVMNDIVGLVALASLYELEEVDYTQKFLTEFEVIEGDCPHCANAKEISVHQLEKGEVVIIPCVCSDRYVAPLASDMQEAPVAETEDAPTTEQAPTEVVARIEIGNQEMDASQLHQHLRNQYAVLNQLGYNVGIINGVEVAHFNFIVAGNEVPQVEPLLEKLLTCFDADHIVYPSAYTTVADSSATFEAPRILTPTEIAMKRLQKDLTLVRDVDALMVKFETDFLNFREIESEQLVLNPDRYTATQYEVETFVRVLTQLSHQQNARYIVVNPQNNSTVTSTYFKHNDIYYLATLYRNQGESPHNYTLTKSNPSNENFVTTESYLAGLQNILNDVSAQF